MKKRLFICWGVIVFFVNLINAQSRNDLIEAINSNDFPSAVSMLDGVVWQYKEGDENFLSGEKYNQFFAFCNQNAKKEVSDIVGAYYVQMCRELAFLCINEDSIAQAEKFYNIAIDLSETLSMPRYAKERIISYKMLGDFFYFVTKDFESSVVCYQIANSIWQNNITSLDDLYWTIVQNKVDALEATATQYRETEDWQNARECYAYEAFELKRLNGEQNAQYALALNREAIMASSLKDYVATDSLLTISKKILEIPGVDKDSSYTYVWDNLMQNYFNQQKFEKILKECDNVEKLRKKQSLYVKEDSFMYWKVVALCNLALEKIVAGDYEVAENLLIQANSIDCERKKISNARDTGFGNISDILVGVKYERETTSSEVSARDLNELNFLLKQGRKDATTIFYLFRTANYFWKVDNCREEYRCYKMAYDMIKENPVLWREISEKNRLDYYMGIASLYCRYEPAIFSESDINEGFVYMSKIYGENSLMFYQYKDAVAEYYDFQYKLDISHSIYNEIIEEITALFDGKKIKKDDRDAFNHILCSAVESSAYYYEKVEKNYEKEWQVYDRLFSRKDYAQYLDYDNWILLCCELGKYDRIWDVLPKYYSLNVDKVNGILEGLTTEEQNAWYHREVPFFYDNFVFKALHNADSIPEHALDAICNNEIFKKGLLLRTSDNLAKYVVQSGDVTAKQLYNEIVEQKKEMLALQNQLNVSDSIVWELQNSIDTKERLLSSLSSDYIRNQKEEVILWKDIRDKLKPNEVVIEFTNGETTGAYWAFVYRKDYKHPKLVEFNFYATEQYKIPCPLMKIGDKVKEVYEFGKNGTKLYEALWKPLEPFMKVGETVYFSPSGVLHSLAVEQIPYDSTSTMSDHFKMVRLTSTRELVTRNKKERKETAAIYGGIQYDVDTAELLAESRLYDYSTLLASRDIDEDTINRGSVRYLFGTKREAESISNILTKHNVSATFFTSTAANEESFKALSGKHQNIIHIGTHGFYWADSTAQKKDYFTQRTISLWDNAPQQQTIDPLDRCGLLFAGANMALSGHSRDLPEGVQDGILTAREISLMDLRDCDLVVLSACETAKGDITSEGVFGLQRAFKMAGVQTIIMSLWKVDDNATQMLMTEFYTNWIEKNQTKREAFRNAQNAVRYAVDEYGDRMYEDPRYWAGFVMLD